MDTALLLNTSFIPPKLKQPIKPLKVKPKNTKQPIKSSIHPDLWSLSDDNKNNFSKPKPISKNPKNPLSDDNARRIMTGIAHYLGLLRKYHGPQAHTPKWIKRTPEQMVRYLEDDRHGHLYGKHVVATIKMVKGMNDMVERSEFQIWIYVVEG